MTIVVAQQSVIISGPTLLTGICFCAACGMAMTLRTGKGGRYRYYTCSTQGPAGRDGLQGPNRADPLARNPAALARFARRYFGGRLQWADPRRRRARRALGRLARGV
jgi:hypothetical protein